jgi:hypothetical protein
MVPTLDSFMDLYQDSTPNPQDEAGIKIVLGIVRRFHELGDALGLGTDFIIRKGKQAGMPLREMEMLLAAGLTPMEVIEAGTRVSAIACGHGDELGLLARGPGAYDQFLELTENSFIKLGEWLVVAAAILHGLNGIRIVLTSFGVGVTRQKQLFYVFMAIAALVILIFTIRMY